MKNIQKKRLNRYFLTAGLTGASLFTGCANYSKEQADDRALRGFINLEAVRDAFEKNQNVEDFEKRVNEIYEGDHVVIFKATETNQGFVYAAYEDLDKSQEVSSKDDQLFSLTLEWETATLRGYGANNYYNESWPFTPQEPEEEAGTETAAAEASEADPKAQRDIHHHHYHRQGYGGMFFWGYMYHRRGWGGYYTPRNRYAGLVNHRDSYRNSSDYKQQTKQNSRFENKMSKQYGRGFRNSTASLTTARKSYAKTSPKARSSKSFSSRSSGRSGKGFSGFRGSSGFGI